MIQGDQVTQGAFVEIVYILRDIFQNFERADNLIKERIEDICERKKISAEEAFYFYILLVFLFSKHDVNLTLFMKNSCLLLLCK